MAEPASALDWARSAHLPAPVPWGRIEREVLIREPSVADDRPAWVFAVGAVGWLWVALLFTVTWGAALVGAALVGVAFSRDNGVDPWLSTATVAFGLGLFSQLLALYQWWSSGRRRGVGAPLVALAALVPAAAATAALVLGDAAGTGEVEARTGLVAFVTALASAVVLVVVSLSTPEGRAANRKPPRRGPRNDTQRTLYLKTRAAVLDVLLERGVVTLDEADRIRMTEMPLGYWEELDGADERQRRHILECRLTGWRDFDETDRRPWPPVSAPTA